MLLGKQLADIGAEINVSRRACTRGHEDGLLFAPSEAGWDADCSSELVLRC